MVLSSQQLNPHQARAVNSTGHSTILACPGSGKTRVLSARAARLLSENATGRLCAVTFTRDAAAEIKLRILKLCGESAAKRLAVGTFHSIALAQIKRSGSIANMHLLSDGERLALLRRCYQQYHCDVPFVDVVSAIDGAKSSLNYRPFDNQSIEDVLDAYQELLTSERAMDFSDILLTATKGMRDGLVKPLSIHWLLVDEAQDMDEVQVDWVIQHGLSGIEVTIVGDDDQSLYAFRHAMGYEGMQHVSDTLVSQQIMLPINYRCADNILKHASILIANNQNRAHKLIQADRKNQGAISLHRAADRIDEANRIVATIKDSGSLQWAVLARTNSLLEVVEASLVGASIPCVVAGGKSVWDGVVGSALVGLLRSIQQNLWTGMANALSLCDIPADLLNRHIENKQCDSMLGMILDSISQENAIARRTIQSLIRGSAEWSAQLAHGNVSLMTYAASNWLAQHIKGRGEDRARREGLIKILAENIAKMRGTLPQRLNYLSRQQNLDAVGVKLMTLHGSKGLEFDNVWILGAEDGNLPHPDSTEEDERRLFYVGITRARDRLEISSSLADGSESRFIQEAGFRKE